MKNETVVATRTRTVARNIELTKEYVKSQEEWMLSKFWPTEAMAFPMDAVHLSFEASSEDDSSSPTSSSKPLA